MHYQHQSTASHTPKRHRFPVFAFYAVLLLLAACVPAQVPPQLAHTPGASITIDEDTINAGDFTVGYPRGWRVVKLNVAGTPAWFSFISPDDDLHIQVRAMPYDDDVVAAIEETITLNGTSLYLRGLTETGASDHLQTHFDWIQDHITPNN